VSSLNWLKSLVFMVINLDAHESPCIFATLFVPLDTRIVSSLA
jgi:hypothetical protein